MKNLIFKIFSLLSVVRGYNILVLIAALYLAAIFIFSVNKDLPSIFSDFHLHFIVLANVVIIAAGYIINNFYDEKVDLINRPVKTSLDAHVKQETKLSLYFFLNCCGFVLAWMVSWRAALFFSAYIFGIWFYSHKLKKYPFISLLTVTILTITPFFSIFLHFKNYSKVIFIHGAFLFLVILIRELIKDLENIKGAIANNYNTFPIVYGEKKTKQVIYVLLLLTLIPIITLFKTAQLQYMKYYFYLAIIFLLFVGVMLKKATYKNQYRLLHNVLKLILLAGVFSLIFIDKTLILDKVIDVLD